MIEVAPLEPYVSGLLCLRIPQGSTIADALDTLGVQVPEGVMVGIWGRRAERARVLEGGDRLEFTRPLLVDPKAARRARATRSGNSR